MPDFIVIDEVNNKVEQSESNILSELNIVNNHNYTYMNQIIANVSGVYNGVNHLFDTRKDSSNGQKVVVYSNTGWINSTGNFGTIAAKFIPTITGIYYVTGNFYSNNISCGPASFSLHAFYRDVDDEGKTIFTESNVPHYTKRGLYTLYNAYAIGDTGNYANSSARFYHMPYANIYTFGKEQIFGGGSAVNGVGFNCPI